MARLEINRSGEMEVFARAVELGGFSPAARALKMTPSAVSKLVSRLEARLGARLINRSTRKLTLTAEGQLFHERTLRVLADLDEAESAVAASQAPRGRVRINSNVPFGLHHLLPLVPRFSALYPKVILDIVLSDTVVDLMDARTDVAIRVGPMRASQLMARKLGESAMAVVASPAYLARHGAPRRRATWPPTTASASTSPAIATSGRSSWAASGCPCRSMATPPRVTARPRGSWPWSARAWPGWPTSISAPTSPPAGGFSSMIQWPESGHDAFGDVVAGGAHDRGHHRAEGLFAAHRQDRHLQLAARARNSRLSTASWSNAANCAKPECMAPGRA
jgi:DNA-binding transcriptional LysR family regulator